MNKVLEYGQTQSAKNLEQGRTGDATQHSLAEIQQWLIVYLAGLLEMAYADVDVATPFDEYGLDSAAAVGMTGELEAWLEQDVDPTLPYIYTTIETLARHLAAGVNIKSHGEEAL